MRARARPEKSNAGDLLSELAREALKHRRRAPEGDALEGFYGFEPPSRGEAVSNELIDKLRDKNPA
ncbi:MAG TPA: antitoxin [Thermoanaerobaculia bacterium]|nr:antitoxin [Thermoanaerobaculia bacterium]